MAHQTKSPVVIKEKAPPISSPLLEKPSIYQLVQAYGTDAVKYIPAANIYEYFFANFPTVVSYDTTMSIASFGGFIGRIKDKLLGPKSSKLIKEQNTLIPITELHVPKVNECAASFEQSYQARDDFGFELSVAGIGAGASKSKLLGYSTSIEISDNCIAVAVPARFQIYEDVYRDGTTVPRAEIVEIGDTLQTPTLEGDDDHCGITQDKVAAAKWKNKSIQVPSGVKRKENTALESSYEGKFSLKLDVGAVKFGPLVSVKYLKKAVYTYSLKGPRNYNAYLPLDNLGYCWNWS